MSDKSDSKLKKAEERAEKKLEKQKAKALDRARIEEEKRQDKEHSFMYDDPLGFMRIVNIISVILLVTAIFFGARYIINGVFLLNYKHGNYSYKTQKFLQVVNIPEGYLPYYNAGNAYYMLGDYDNAISSYKSALESHPPEKKECDIRVNLALAMLHKIDFDHLETEKQKANAIRQLQAARNVLCERGCADPYGTNGHDPEAEQLKQDIDKMLEELGGEPEPPDSDDQDQNKKQQQKEDKKKSNREEQLEKELEEQKQDAMEERTQTQNTKDQQSGSQTGGGGGGNDFNGKTW
ncbi:MAG: tetratricopeptide repeat protein [Eubacterium sp.]|nr:tetratricopeptide repeat protein [Eubacterium sp.]